MIDAPQYVTESGHTVWDSMAIELETGELLYALARELKPDLIVESGTGRGFATYFLAKACLFNKKGRVITFEPEEEFRVPITEEFSKIKEIEVRDGDSTEAGLEPQMVFVDCWGKYRLPVIEHWLTHPLRPLVVVHDANRNYPFHLGEGVHIPGHDGVWIGRAKEFA